MIKCDKMVYPESETKFFLKVIDAQIIFVSYFLSKG